MGLFNLFNKNETKPEEDYYVANAQFYGDANGNIFGAFALTETTETALPIDPRSSYTVQGKRVDEWKLSLVSITKDSVLGEVEYYRAIEKLKKYSTGEKNGCLITKGLTLEELYDILNN